MGNSAMRRVIGEGIIQFRSNNACITTLQGVYHVPESRYSIISLGALHEEGFNLNFEGDLMKVFKDAQVKFLAERVGNIYSCEIRRLQLVHCNYPRSKLGGCGIIEDYDGFELRCLVLLRRHMGLGGADTKQENQDHYSCIRANSHKFCVDQKIIG